MSTITTSTRPIGATYGVAETENSTAKSQEILIWTGAFMSEYVGYGRIRRGAKSVTITTTSGERIRVVFPEGVTSLRTDTNYRQIDQAINATLAEILA